MRNAVQNAVANALRKKNKRAMPLWKKKQKKVDKDKAQEQMQLVLEIEARDGDSWVDAIYKANGRRRPR